MGYTTDFQGSFAFDKPLTEKQRNYINLISSTRRMKRDIAKLYELYNGEHGNPFLPKDQTYGVEGEFFAKDDGDFGQSNDASIVNYNNPSETQPGLWCQWVVTDDGGELKWDGGEKFYHYVDWLKYLIDKFFKPWGVVLNGNVQYFGEDREDFGSITISDNEVEKD